MCGYVAEDVWLRGGGCVATWRRQLRLSSVNAQGRLYIYRSAASPRFHTPHRYVVAFRIDEGSNPADGSLTIGVPPKKEPQAGDPMIEHHEHHHEPDDRDEGLLGHGNRVMKGGAALVSSGWRGAREQWVARRS